eukprot:scaffold401335_cov13-Prasinocladus_malaysianus.AAC.1
MQRCTRISSSLAANNVNYGSVILLIVLCGVVWPQFQPVQRRITGGWTNTRSSSRPGSHTASGM